MFYGALKILALTELTFPMHVVCRGHGTDETHTMQLGIVTRSCDVTETRWPGGFHESGVYPHQKFRRHRRAQKKCLKMRSPRSDHHDIWRPWVTLYLCTDGHVGGWLGG